MARCYLPIAGILAALLLAAGPALGGNGVGPGDGSGPIHSFEEFTYKGLVDQYLEGMGMTLCETADSGCITVYGVGPVSYWNSLEVDRPAVGEIITVSYYTVVYDVEPRNIATLITLADGTEVELRDEDGTPLWR